MLTEAHLTVTDVTNEREFLIVTNRTFKTIYFIKMTYNLISKFVQLRHFLNSQLESKLHLQFTSKNYLLLF